MKKWLIISLIISVLIVVAVIILIVSSSLNSCSGCEPLSEKPNNFFYCNSPNDCVLVNNDCSDCSCNNYTAVNKNFATKYKNKICYGISTEVMCDMICEPILKAPECVNHECK